MVDSKKDIQRPGLVMNGIKGCDIVKGIFKFPIVLKGGGII
jgi:hypothetical protein